MCGFTVAVSDVFDVDMTACRVGVAVFYAIMSKAGS